MTFSAKHVRHSAAVLAVYGRQLKAGDIRVMPALHDEFQETLLAGLADIALADAPFTGFANYSNLTDFEMEDFDEGPHHSECPPYEAMFLSSWTRLESGESMLFAKLPNVDHDRRQAWMDDDKTSVHIHAERVIPAQGVRCLPEHVQLTVDGSHEVFEDSSLLPVGVDFTRIVLRETDTGLEFIFPADDTALDDMEAPSADCPQYEQMEVTDWKLLPSGEFELQAILPAVEPSQSKVQLSEDRTALHIHAWRAITVSEECFPEGTQTAISGDGQYEIFERAVLLPDQVDITRLSVSGIPNGYKVTAPTVVIEDTKAIESEVSHQSEPDGELDIGKEDGVDRHAMLADFDFNLPELCPSYHPLQVSPWRMTLAGFQMVVAFPGVDPEDFQITLHAATNRLSVRTSRPVPKEGRLCLPITTQVSPDGSQELVDVLIMMPHGCGATFLTEDFEHGIKITAPFLASPSQPGFGLSFAPSLDPPRKLAEVLDDALKFAEEQRTLEKQFPSLDEEAETTGGEKTTSDAGRVSESLPRAESRSPQSCPEYEAMTSQDWQIVDGSFILDVTMPGVPPEMREAEFKEDGLLHVSGSRSLSAGNLWCLPLQAVTTVSVVHGLQELLDVQVALPLGGDATRVTVQQTRLGLQFRMPIIARGAESRKVHEV